MPCGTSDPKAIGALITYLRRYQLQTIFGIPSVDDEEQVPGFERVSDSQVKAIKALIDNLGYSEPDVTIENLCGFLKVSDITELRADRYEEAVQVLTHNAPEHEQPAYPTLDEMQMGTLREKAKAKKFSNIPKTMDRLAEKFGVKSLRDIPKGRFAEAMDALEAGPK